MANSWRSRANSTGSPPTPGTAGVKMGDAILAGMRRNLPIALDDLPDEWSRSLWCDLLNTGGDFTLATLKAGSVEEAYAALETADPGSDSRRVASVCLVLGGEIARTVLAGNWTGRTAG